MYCSHCGKEISDTTKFCQYCGAGTSDNTSSTTQTAVTGYGNKIKCNNCSYEGDPINGRNSGSKFLAWICIAFAPLITLIYYVVTYKHKCPNCKSTHIAVRNKDGNYKNQNNDTAKTLLKIILGIAVFGIIASVILASLNSAHEYAEVASDDDFETENLTVDHEENLRANNNLAEVETNEINRGKEKLSQIAAVDQRSMNGSDIDPNILSSAGAIANIICSDTRDYESFGPMSTGGSGTLVLEDGFIITNSHIFPQDDYYLYVEDYGCLVTLPDVETGQVDRVFIASPNYTGQMSEDYDIAFVTLEAEIDDEGNFIPLSNLSNNTFRIEEYCYDYYPKLGEPITVYGYPSSTGGSNLTITNGVVSSFDSGLIYTSAKIDHGNSGGLAVSDRTGCMVGIPTMVQSGGLESYGILLSMDMVFEFLSNL